MLLDSSRRRLGRLHTRIRLELALLFLLLDVALRRAVPVQTATLPQHLICLVRLPEDRLALLRVHLARLRLWSDIATVGCRLEGLGQDSDKVGGKETNRPRVSSQSAHPPRPIAGVQRFDQVAFDEAQVLLRLAAPGVCGLAPARKTWQLSRCAHCNERGGQADYWRMSKSRLSVSGSERGDVVGILVDCCGWLLCAIRTQKLRSMLCRLSLLIVR